jgi:hypothetical protein
MYTSKEKAKKKTGREKDYFGISVYIQEDIAVVVLFADNLSRGDTYTYTFYII